MENLRDFLPQDLVLAVFVTYFVFKEICDLEWVDTWFAFPAFVSCGIFGDLVFEFWFVCLELCNGGFQGLYRFDGSG